MALIIIKKKSIINIYAYQINAEIISLALFIKTILDGQYKIKYRVSST